MAIISRVVGGLECWGAWDTAGGQTKDTTSPVARRRRAQKLKDSGWRSRLKKATGRLPVRPTFNCFKGNIRSSEGHTILKWVELSVAFFYTHPAQQLTKATPKIRLLQYSDQWHPAQLQREQKLHRKVSNKMADSLFKSQCSNYENWTHSPCGCETVFRNKTKSDGQNLNYPKARWFLSSFASSMLLKNGSTPKICSFFVTVCVF